MPVIHLDLSDSGTALMTTVSSTTKPFLLKASWVTKRLVPLRRHTSCMSPCSPATHRLGPSQTHGRGRGGATHQNVRLPCLLLNPSLNSARRAKCVSTVKTAADTLPPAGKGADLWRWSWPACAG